MINEASRTPRKYFLPVAHAAFLLLLCIGIAACTQDRDPCLTPKIASLNVECVHFPTDTSLATLDTALPLPYFGALTNSGIQLVKYPTSALFTLSLSSNANSCQWLMATDSTNFDTLTFYYQRQLKFLSNACGFTYFYNLDSVRYSNNYHNIDSILITNTSVTTNVNTEHLKIFIHPDY